MDRVGILVVAILLCYFSACKWIKYVESIHESSSIRLSGKKLRSAQSRKVDGRE